MLKHHHTEPIRDATKALAKAIHDNVTATKSDGNGSVYQQGFIRVPIATDIDKFKKPYNDGEHESDRVAKLPVCVLGLPAINEAAWVYQSRSELIDIADAEQEPTSGFVDVPGNTYEAVFNVAIITESALEMVAFCTSFVRYFTHNGTELSVYDAANNVTECLEVMMTEAPDSSGPPNSDGIYVASAELKICAINVQQHTAREEHTVRELALIQTRTGYTAVADENGNIQIIKKEN